MENRAVNACVCPGGKMIVYSGIESRSTLFQDSVVHCRTDRNAERR